MTCSFLLIAISSLTSKCFFYIEKLPLNQQTRQPTKLMIYYRFRLFSCLLSSWKHCLSTNFSIGLKINQIGTRQSIVDQRIFDSYQFKVTIIAQIMIRNHWLQSFGSISSFLRLNSFISYFPSNATTLFNKSKKLAQLFACLPPNNEIKFLFRSLFHTFQQGAILNHSICSLTILMTTDRKSSDN